VGHSIVVILGGSDEETAAVAEILAKAAPRPPLDADAAATLARSGLAMYQGCIRLEPAEAEGKILATARQAGVGVAFVALGTRYFPELPEEVPVFRVQLADEQLLGTQAPRWQRLLAWMARHAIPGARRGYSAAVRARRVGVNAAEAKMRERLHEFDQACRRAVSFLNRHSDWS
jgi:hypothetical protein